METNPKNSITEENLKGFKAISDFIICLDEAYGKDFKSVELYCHLLKKTTILHKAPILKHITSFRNFCVENREAIQERDEEKLVKKQIIYSMKVFVDIGKIFAVSDPQSKKVIWDHLTNITTIVDPTGIIKRKLKKHSGGKENEFLTNIINKVESSVNPDTDPMEAVGDIMKSGIFNELLSNMGEGLENGDLDLSKLMGTVQTMVSTLSPEDEDGKQNESLKTMIGMLGGNNENGQPPDLSALMGGVDGQPPDLSALMGGGVDGQPPDLSAMMSLIGPMMQQMTKPPTNTETKT